MTSYLAPGRDLVISCVWRRAARRRGCPDPTLNAFSSITARRQRQQVVHMPAHDQGGNGGIEGVFGISDRIQLAL